MPYDTDLSAITPDIKVSKGAEVKPASGETVDFENGDVLYTVRDDRENERKYRVHVSRIKKGYPSFLSFTFNDSEKVVAPYKRTYRYKNTINDIFINLPEGMDLTSLSPTIITTEGVTVSPASNTPQDFSEPVRYTLTTEDGGKNWIWIYALNFKPKITSISSNTVTIEDTITLRGRFAEKNEMHLTCSGELSPIYRHQFEDWPELEIVSENESEIKAIISVNIIEGLYGIKVMHNEMSDETDVMILNPQKPIIESLDKEELRVGMDSLMIRGKNLHEIHKILLFSKKNGNSIAYYTSEVNGDRTELVLKSEPVLVINEFHKSEVYSFRLENGRTVSLEEVPIRIVMEKDDLYKYHSRWSANEIEFPDEEE